MTETDKRILNWQLAVASASLFLGGISDLYVYHHLLKGGGLMCIGGSPMLGAMSQKGSAKYRVAQLLVLLT